MSVICPGCGFPAKKGVVPIIWPSKDSGRIAYCSVGCFEKIAKVRLPEPMRSKHTEAEEGKHNG